MKRLETLETKRITPACAGKTRASSWALSSFPDHPRMRGEDTIVSTSANEIDGSPPHARGRLFYLAPTWECIRITPACAGKTNVSRRFITPGRDHPRMRGEDGCVALDEAWIFGSPPHARGRPNLVRRSTPTHRITPACAGKTQSARGEES